MIKKFIHTSDWHIGRKLKDFERYDEFRKFFDWLENLIKIENVDALFVSGDIFDNTTPSTQSQEIYYSFLAKISKSNCRHVIIISGNHDSPTFLDAPSEILNLCNIYVIGQACENPDDEIIILKDENEIPEMIVCAVPYLRDRDVRKLNSNDNSENIEQDLISGITEHYSKIFEKAKILHDELKIPVVAMGHLFAKGGSTKPDDGVRSLYVGTAVEIKSDIFSKQDFLTYTALGHLHSAQKILQENIRYSGSPLAMSFGEAEQKKSVYVIELEDENLIEIKNIPVPVFQKLKRISGNKDEIVSKINGISSENQLTWLDISYTGTEAIGFLLEQLNDFTKNFPNIEILSLKDESKIFDNKDNPVINTEIFEKITPLDILKLKFKEQQTPEETQEIMLRLYEEILAQMEIN